MWNIRLYYETGFNAVNIPDSPALLETMKHADFPALDILQGEHLSYVNVKATRAQVKNADYMRLTDGTDTFYYIVEDFTMTSTDVAMLSIVMDYFTTHGGVTGIAFLDGVVERHHVAVEDDKYGAYTEDDPMLVPSKELEFDEVSLFTDMVTEGTTKSHIIIETTLDMKEIATNANAINYNTSGGDSVTVPLVNATTKVSAVNVYVDANDPSVLTKEFITPKTVYCDAGNENVISAIGRARSLGVEDGILNSYIVPDAAVVDYANGVDADGNVATITGAHKFENTDLDFEYATVNNKRVLYGSLNSFMLVSPANGNSVTFKPEDIAYDSFGDITTSPRVCMNTDPRPDGRPYFRFEYYKGNNYDFFLNALKGMEWANAPLVYQRRSGEWQAKLQHDATTGMLEREQNMENSAYKVNKYLGFVGAFKQGTDFVGMEKQQAFEQAIDSNYNLGSMGFNIGMDFVTSGMQLSLSKSKTKLHFKDAFLQETVGYVSGKVVAPDLRFAMSETLRDFRGNGCIVYRYRPQTSDIEKLDKVLTMYGYQDTNVLAGHEEYMTNRRKFNYLKASGVSVAGNKPKWLRDGVAMQLSVGTRIWHVKPDASAYTDGSNV